MTVPGRQTWVTCHALLRGSIQSGSGVSSAEVMLRFKHAWFDL